MNTVMLCAAQELTMAVRSRWTQIFAVAFAVLALAVACSGYILSGGSGVQDFARTATSLTQLVLFLVPMIALLVGTTALSADRGAAELLYSQPVSRTAVLAGKLLGLLEALTAAQAIGFGAAGLAIFSQSGGDGLSGFVLLFVASTGLTAAFLGIAALLASGAGRRSRALGTAVVVWFVAVLLYDVAALGAASLFRSGTASRILMVATLANPVDAVRTGVLLAIQGTSAFGAASLALLRFTNGPTGAAIAVCASLIVWIVVPSVVAARRLTAADI